jgi:signal transduction histidine kinase
MPRGSPACDHGFVSNAVAVPTESPPPLARRRSGRLVAGVAGGVADHLGIDVLWVRAGFVVLATMSGAGVLAYGLLWIFVRQERADVTRAVPRRERQQALGLAALGIGCGLAAAALGNNVIGWIVGPLGVAAVGAAVVWREADESQRRRWAAGARSGVVSGGRTALVRIAAGALFVTTGIGVFLVGNLDLSQVQFGLLAVLATLVGVAVLTIPWWVRLMSDLGEERRERIVEAERAEIAAHLHDSVLQTLALIQRQSDQPREVLRLARGQERELRHWLYGPGGYGRAGSSGPGLDSGVAEALTAAAAEVEDTYALTVSPVVVGDRPLDDGLRALVLAAREAMVNAAKHADVDEVSVYAEVEPEAVNVFVRDRGTGFDPDSVPEDRHGLADSVHGRMTRHGGTVRLRSAPGDGTEVHLCMPVDGAVPAGPVDGEAGEPAHDPAEDPPDDPAEELRGPVGEDLPGAGEDVVPGGDVPGTGGAASARESHGDRPAGSTADRRRDPVPEESRR